MQELLNTSQVPEHERIDYWRRAMSRVLKSPCRVEPRAGAAFAASMGVMNVGALEVIDIAGTACRATRSGPADDDAAALVFQRDGVGVVADGRRSARLAPGDFCVLPHGDAVVIDHLGGFRQTVVRVPAAELDSAVPRWRERTALTIESTRPRVRPASELLRYVLEHCADLDAACRERLAGAALALIVGVLDGHGAEAAKPRCGMRSRVAAFHRQRIERFILDNLRDPELSVTKIAQELGLSTRYVHKLFETEPEQVMQHAMAHRLRACQGEVARRGSRSISEIAYAWGFNSPAHFSRVFKKHFGARPSDF